MHHRPLPVGCFYFLVLSVSHWAIAPVMLGHSMMMLAPILSLLSSHQFGMKAEFLRGGVTTDILFHWPKFHVSFLVLQTWFFGLDSLPAATADILSFMRGALKATDLWTDIQRTRKVTFVACSKSLSCFCPEKSPGCFKRPQDNWIHCWVHFRVHPSIYGANDKNINTHTDLSLTPRGSLQSPVNPAVSKPCGEAGWPWENVQAWKKHVKRIDSGWNWTQDLLMLHHCATADSHMLQFFWRHIVRPSQPDNYWEDT